MWVEHLAIVSPDGAPISSLGQKLRYFNTKGNKEESASETKIWPDAFGILT